MTSTLIPASTWFRAGLSRCLPAERSSRSRASRWQLAERLPGHERAAVQPAVRGARQAEEVPAAGMDQPHAGNTHASPLLRSQLAVRAEVRRRALSGFPQEGWCPSLFQEPEAAESDLSRDRRGPRRPAPHGLPRRRRNRGARRHRRMQLSDANAARRSGVAGSYYVFDVPYVGGYDTTALGLRCRKLLLERALSYADPLRFTTHWDAEGEAAFRDACARGWEGVIAKRADSSYVQRRSTAWLKFKCVNQQEFVIGGF